MNGELIRQKIGQLEIFRNQTIPEDDYINPWEARTISVREMARCQSFDDSFEFLGKRTTGGNAKKNGGTTVYSSGKCSSTAISKSGGRSNHASIVDVGMQIPVVSNASACEIHYIFF